MAGAIYGLKNLSDFALKTGTSLYKFKNAFGLSSMELQKWQIWMRDFGASDEVQGTIEDIQKAMMDAKLGLNGMPEAFGRLNINWENKTPFEVLDEIQRKIKGMSPELGMALSKGLINSSNMFQALRTFKKRAIGPAEMLTNAEQDNLQKINAEWEKFWWQLKIAGSKVIGENGTGFIGGLQDITDGVQKAVMTVKDLKSEFKSLEDALPGIKIAIAAAFGPLAAVVVALGEIMAKQKEMDEANVGAKGAMRDEESWGGWFKSIGDQMTQGASARYTGVTLEPKDTTVSDRVKRLGSTISPAQIARDKQMATSGATKNYVYNIDKMSVNANNAEDFNNSLTQNTLFGGVK